MFEPSSLVIVADRPLPAAGSLSPALKAKTTVVACEAGAAPDLRTAWRGWRRGAA